MSPIPTPPLHRSDDSLHVAIAGPMLTAPLAQFLDGTHNGLPPGQAFTPVVPLIAELVGRGRRVTAVTLDSGVSSSVMARGPLLGVVYGPYRPRHRMRDLMSVERNAVRDGVLRTRPDLVHAHWCYEYALGALASGIPTLVTVRDWMPTLLRMIEARYWPYWSGRMLMYFATLARARYVTANSPYIAARIRGFTRASVEVVPNGVPDAQFLTPKEQRLSGRPVPAGRSVIVSVNNGFSRWKNVRRLLEAFRVLRQQGINCELRLVGDGYESCGACHAWARQRRLEDGVAFVGPLPHIEVLRSMREATLLAHPALEESFGMTLVEAMSQRTPVLGGARSGAVPWVLGGGKAGLLADVNDARAIARALETLLAQPAERERLAAAGYEHAWRTFRQSRVVSLYLDAYRRLLDAEARR